MSSPVVHFALLLIPLFLPWTVADNSTSISEGDHIAKPGCLTKCGNLTVPYPFGIGINSGCSFNPFFDISCNKSFYPARAFIGTDNLEVVGIYDTKVRIKNQPAFLCLNASGRLVSDSHETSISINLTGGPFSFSTENKLTVVACDATSLLSLQVSDDDYDPISSCIAICNKTEDLRNGSCSGIGCCQSSISKGLQSIFMVVGVISNKPSVWSFNPCSYSFISEKNSYTFQVSDISADPSTLHNIVEPLPLAIDWEIGRRNCSQAQNSRGGVICRGKSVCVDSDTSLGGYRCNCSRGYKGNPYLPLGCQDINECEFNPCHEKATCTNFPGSFNCSCHLGYLGDGMKDGVGCVLLPRMKKTTLYSGLLAGFVSFLVLLFSFGLYRMLKKRGKNNIKKKYFKRNGGLLLKQQMSADDQVLDKMRTFTSKELERATDRFNENLILGQGGQGTVYKGMLSDGRTIAVKKSRKLDENQLEEFINEVFILSHINHKNVVKLHGCCLETEVPMLVYEFVPNGTLYDLIHDGATSIPFSWDMRLRIAAEVANGLAYLHYATSVPIYHRDMKSSNILLDEKYRAKISDFGISRSIAIDQTHLTTKVQGTFGYVDPEYFQRGKFTGKSDVYSFGVVLVELLTGQKPISTATTDEERSLVTRFLLSVEEDMVRTILDPNISEHVATDELLAVANLARRCLNLNGKRRPNIRDVAMELESIRTCENQSSVECSNIEETSIEKDFLGVDLIELSGESVGSRC